MTPDLSEFEALSKPKRLKCSIVAVLEELKPEDAEKLKAALAANSDRIRHSVIGEWLSKRGIKVSAYTISRHRRGLCSCHD